MRPKPRHVIAHSLPNVVDEQAQHGMWLLPSRNRQDRALACIEACSDAGQETPGMLIQDGCRYSFARSVPKITGALYPGMPKRWSAIQTPEHRELCGSLTYATQMFPDLDWYGVISDGVRPKTQGWDRLLLAASEGRNFVSCSDSGWREDSRMAGILLVPGWIIRAMGYWFPPKIRHLWSDDCLEALGEALGNWVYAEDVVVEDNHHSHPNPANKTPFDHVRIFNGDDLNQTDRAAFNDWRYGPEFSSAVQRIKDSWKAQTGIEWERNAA